MLPPLEGETLTGKKASLPAAANGRAALLILGFTHASQHQTKAWADRVQKEFPTFSVAVLEEAPRLVRGMITHGIRSGVPKDQQDRFLLVYHGEKELKQAAGFDRPDDAYLLIIGPDGRIRWRYHGPVTDAAVEQIKSKFAE